MDSIYLVPLTSFLLTRIAYYSRTSLFVLSIRPPPSSTLFPYTTLFRSVLIRVYRRGHSVRGEHRHRCEEPHGNSPRSEEHTSEPQSHHDLVCRLLLEKKKNY